MLGEHQDSVVAREALRELGVRMHLDGDNAFTIGRLHALEQTRGEKATDGVRGRPGPRFGQEVWLWLK